MTEHNRITGDPVIIAPHRADRPHVDHFGACPFCPGHESETPPAIATDGDPWRIRVFPNKYPATEWHEVVVESARHDDHFADLDPDHAARAVAMSFERYAAMRTNAAHVSLFKNHGPRAGASIQHLHSQIIGTPFVPPRVARERDAFARAAACPLCDLSDEPLIEATEHYRWITPRGASFAYQQWIVPVAHENEMREPHELAALLQASSGAMRAMSSSYNSMFLNFPGEERAHWYVELMPRSAMIAGYELGSGAFINTIEAAGAAAAFRRGAR